MQNKKGWYEAKVLRVDTLITEKEISDRAVISFKDDKGEEHKDSLIINSIPNTFVSWAK